MFAGINSSEKDQGFGKNEHLRAFDIKYPPRKKQKTEDATEQASEKGQWNSLGKRSLFRPSTVAKKETYQRILRLSPSQKRDSGSKRIGAIATGLSKDSQIIVFNATNPTPDPKDILTSIDLPGGAEAADLDIAEPDEAEFSIAYCTDQDIYEQTLKYDFKTKRTERTPNGPRRVHSFPQSEAQSAKSRFRCIRFLNSQNVVVLSNRPNKAGADLQIFHLYPTGPAILIQEMKLPSRIKAAVTMDVCALDADKEGNQQIAVAAAGQDISIEVYTTNYQRHTDTFTPFKNHITLRQVHGHQITKICFSPFHTPPTSEGKPPAQFIRLASVSFGNTVVVDTFPLTLLDPQDKNSRYMLSHPNDEAWTKWAFIFIISIIVLVVAFLVQSFLSDFSDSAPGPYGLLPKEFRDFLNEPATHLKDRQRGVKRVVSSAVDETIPTNMPGKSRLQQLLSAHIHPPPAEGQKPKALILRPAAPGTDGLTMDVHPDKAAYLEKDAQAKHWEDLEEHTKAVWRERLVKAGEWVEGQGEKVLVGVLFSEYAGLVGEVGRGIIGEL